MSIFTQTGHQENDFWLVDGQQEFAKFPANVIEGITDPLPIFLKVGNSKFGAKHIAERHAHWVKRHASSVQELVYLKLGQPGAIYSSEQDSKLKICLRLNPDSLLVLNLFDRVEMPHFSVTSIYAMPSAIDGMRLGKFPGRQDSRLTR